MNRNYVSEVVNNFKTFGGRSCPPLQTDNLYLAIVARRTLGARNPPAHAPSALTTASHRARAHPHALCARTRTHALCANGARPCAHALPLHSHRSRRQRLCSGFDVCPDGLMVAT